MPYIDLVHGADTASIWYETNSALGTVSNFDPAKPTIALLHPMFLCSSWMSYQLHDFRLKSAFNMIAFDHRSSGSSYNKPSPAYDSYVQAADVAYCFQVCPLQVYVQHCLMMDSISVFHQFTSSPLRPCLCAVRYGSFHCTLLSPTFNT
jgi:hypothetical protein